MRIGGGRDIYFGQGIRDIFNLRMICNDKAGHILSHELDSLNIQRWKEQF